MSRWQRQGRIFPAPEGPPTPAWMGTHAALPYAVVAGERGARVYFSGRDPQGRSHVGACTLDLDSLRAAPESLTPEPLLAPGPLGSFDDCGCSVACLVQDAGRLLLYYTGWTRAGTVPFHLAVGLAASEDGGRTFQRLSPAPVLGRHEVDPYLCASPSVLVENGRWRMWYVSALRWEPRPDGARHHYLIKYAESADGIEWRRDGRIAVGFASPEEYAMGRPHVVREGDLYRMWFCVRGTSYRLACAESRDGLEWQRLEPPQGIAEAAEEWDREMQAYPMVLRDRGRWLMLYNGNGYGATGFGAATMPDRPSLEETP